jgi:hypothetical protein
VSRGRRAAVGVAAGLLAVLLIWLATAGGAARVAASTTGQAGAQSTSGGDPTSIELVEHPQRWEEKRISFTGEAVGSVMTRGESAWVHLNDDAYARTSVEGGAPLAGYNSGQAVWVSARLASEIAVCGDYEHQGDVVRVEGVFHAACPQHGGDMDIHADSLTVERVGIALVHPVQGRRVLWLLVLAPLAAGLWWLERRPPASGSGGGASGGGRRI